MYVPPQHLEREREVKKDESASIDAAAYLAALGKLVRELEATASNPAAVRLVRQRLAEWVEDVRSVGGHDELADAVEHLVKRLSAALALGGNVEPEARAIAAELDKLAAGTPPPRGGRLAFWK